MTTRKNPLNFFAKNQKWRFVIVGGANTALDFVIYNLISKFLFLALPIANMISSFLAMIFSFFVNKKWTFRAQGKNYLREIVLFFLVTIFGIWVIQSGIIFLFQQIFPAFKWENFWLKNFAKIAASIPSLIWNYIMYKKVVFKSDNENLAEK